MIERRIIRTETVARPCRLVMFGAMALSPWAALAQAPADEYVYEEEREKWFVRGGVKVLFNVKASVSLMPQVETAGVYDDGFVLPDNGGSAAGTTWNWAYQNSGQITAGQVRFSRLTDVPRAGVMDGEADVGVGAEVLFGAELAAFEVRERPLRLGWELGYGYNPFSVRNRSTAQGTATFEGDSYSLTDPNAPAAPYQGSFFGPGPTVGLTPVVSGSLSSASVGSFDGELESSLHHFKAGLWLDYELSPKVSASVSAGYCAIFADTRLTYDESASFSNPGFAPIVPARTTVGGRDWQPGVYTQLRLGYHFTEHIGAYLGGEIQYNKDLKLEARGREITLELGPAFGVTAGVLFQF